ncbi:HAD family hydrolase [Aquirufa sp.]|jgi:putative hydrolase of the HAD superfamily|uniref:HAD family hydrolase n=1 Tax=Aquirufa sp. TaxID=2676249 RepID=UPI0037C04766
MLIIAFDADDTLWVNEPYFRTSEEAFAALFEDYLPQHTTQQELFKTEMDNLALYGYGVKGFMLSMVETAIRITDGNLSAEGTNRIIEIGKELLNRPIEILPHVEEVLQALSSKYRLVVATKGDLLDQERKLKKSGLAKYFHHIEIMSDKKPADYQKLLQHLDVAPDQFMMIGNSLKSDILPVLDLGGHGIHIPFHTTWAHEMVSHPVEHPNFRAIEHLDEILAFL